MDGERPILRSNLNWFFAVYFLVGSAFLACLGLVSFFLLLNFILYPSMDPGSAALVSFALLFLSIFGFVFGRAALVARSDLMLPRPLLQIDDVGILDQRLGCGLIPWSNIAKITSLGPAHGPSSLLLKLRTPMDADFSRFRVGALWLVCHVPKSKVLVAMHWRTGPQINADKVFAIAKQHGVVTAVWGVSVWTGRLIPVDNRRRPSR